MTTSMPLTREQEVTSAQPLYERVLGEDWHQLDPILRNAHLQGDRITGTGRARFSTGNSLLSRFVCRLLRLPRPGEFAARVVVSKKGDTEIWKRSIGGHFVETVQEESGTGIIMERFGWIEFAIAIKRSENRVTYCSKSARIRIGCVSVPMPKYLQPKIDGVESATHSGNLVEVVVLFPRERMLISYVGEFIWSHE